MPLFSRHSLVLQTAYSELKRQAMEQRLLLVGTPGSVGVREVNGSRFLYRQFYDPQGKKRAEYLGPVDAPASEERARRVREAVEVTQRLVKDARILGQQGYVRVDARTGAILASLARRGLFRAGAVLVGSHAYGALLNELGARGPAFFTEGVDIARDRRLEIALAPEESFARLLDESTVTLGPVPGLDRRSPSTSYKAPGKDRLRVDLLVPARGDEVSIRAVPELNAHAAALPHLRYLLTAPIDSVVLGREGVVPVRVPRPEAFTWHKMLVSRLRSGTGEKRTKDTTQAATLFALLADEAPDALESAFAALPRGTRKTTLSAARPLLAELEKGGHPRAMEMMEGFVRRGG